MLFTIFVAICLSSVDPRECSRHNAADWISVPEEAMGLGACAKLGYEYVSQAGGLIKPGSYPKVFCTAGKPPIPETVG
jgi:hypothetical protein